MPLTYPVIIGSAIYSALVVLTYDLGWHWISIPTFFVSVLGTAVAFYLGFEGNAAYGRLWEARKIWGGIVNISRTWGTHVLGFTDSDHTFDDDRRVLIYRHIAWLAALRTQLRRLQNWEHQKPRHTKLRNFYKTLDMSSARFHKRAKGLLDEAELESIKTKSNAASQLLLNQSQHVARLHQNKAIGDLERIELAEAIEKMFELQGKSERIKNFPLPRQYATTSVWFVRMFICAVPLGMVESLISAEEPWRIWLAVPTSMVLSWVYTMWALVVNYSENPFEGLANDIPMDALSRTIEIDLREMLGETDIPPAQKPISGVLL